MLEVASRLYDVSGLVSCDCMPDSGREPGHDVSADSGHEPGHDVFSGCM